MIELAIISSPVAIFFTVLVIILLAPVVLNKLNIPHIVGMIVAGVVIGPYCLNLLDRDSSFTIFGQVGLLYLMFLAGFEIDMLRLKLNLRRGLLFGIMTFAIPMILGILSSRFLLGLGTLTSVLLGSMYASHTLIAYPVATRLGVNKSPAVIIAVVGTIIAVVGSLLTLAVVGNIHETGSFHPVTVTILLAKLAVYCAAVVYIYPRLTRRFLKLYGDPITQFVFILAMVFLSAIAASAIGLEEVLGAFLAGLVLNRYVPAGSALMSRIEFVGNALFIPYFLIGVGMMINLSVVAEGRTLTVTALMLTVALTSKWVPALLSKRPCRLSTHGANLLFGLTTAHTAVALAVVTIGYAMKDPDGQPMLSQTIVNATIVVILITCAIAPIVTAAAARKVKIDMLTAAAGSDTEAGDSSTSPDEPKRRRILLPIANPVTSAQLVELALLMNPRPELPGDLPQARFFALHVRSDNSPTSKALGRNSLDMAVETAAAVDADLTTIERYDLNIAAGVANVMLERDITDVILGLHRRISLIDSFLGAKVEQLLRSTNRMVMIARCFIPASTFTRIVVYVPPRAQFETGFTAWLRAIANLTRQVGCRAMFCCAQDTWMAIKSVAARERLTFRMATRTFESPDDFVLLTSEVADDDLFVVVSARSTSVSYSSYLAEIPGMLQHYFGSANLLMVYPGQFEESEAVTLSFADPLASDLTSAPSALWIAARNFAANIQIALRRIFRS